jgi:hypothetical protein
MLFLILCPLITPAGSLALRLRAFKRGGLRAPYRNLVAKSKLGNDTTELSLLLNKDFVRINIDKGFTGCISLSGDSKMRSCS